MAPGTSVYQTSPYNIPHVAYLTINILLIDTLAQLKRLTRPGPGAHYCVPGPGVLPGGRRMSDHGIHIPEASKVYIRPLIICVPVTIAPEGDR